MSGSHLAAAASLRDCTTPVIGENEDVFPINENGEAVDNWQSAYIDELGEYRFVSSDTFTEGTATASCIASIMGIPL